MGEGFISRLKPGFARKAVIAAVLGIVFVVYSQCLGGGPISDDIPLFYSGGIPRLSPGVLLYVQQVGEEIPPYYRPVTSLTLALERSIYGTYVIGFHLVNLFFYEFSVLLMYFVLRGLRFTAVRALLGMALFAALPIHVQPVCWISGRADTLCIFFLLLTVFLHLKDSKAHRIAAVFTFLLAVASKENALVLPFLLIVLDIAFGRGKIRTGKYIGYFAVAVFFAALRFHLMGFSPTSYGTSEAPILLSGPLLDRLLLGTQYNALGLFLCLVPYKLALFYPPVEPGFWVGFSSVLLWGLSAIFIWRSRVRWLLVALILTLLPVSGIVVVNTLSDRYMFLPSVVLVFCAVRFLPGRKALAACAVLVAVYFGISGYYIGDWKDRVVFYQRWSERYDMPSVHFAYASVLMDLEGLKVERPEPLALYHWYYGCEIYRRQGREVPPQALIFKKQLLNRWRSLIGLPLQK